MRLRKDLGIKARIRARAEISFALMMTLAATVLGNLTAAGMEAIMNHPNAVTACVFVGVASLRSHGWVFNANGR